jgi:hypothetical protein
MRKYELRVYTLKSFQVLEEHRNSYAQVAKLFPKFDIGFHGLWTAPADAEPRLYVLCSYASDANPRQVEREFLQSAEMAAIAKNVDPTHVLGVSTTGLEAGPGSPLA